MLRNTPEQSSINVQRPLKIAIVHCMMSAYSARSREIESLCEDTGTWKVPVSKGYFWSAHGGPDIGTKLSTIAQKPLVL